jgi:hypothetical protein
MKNESNAEIPSIVNRCWKDGEISNATLERLSKLTDDEVNRHMFAIL